MASSNGLLGWNVYVIIVDIGSVRGDDSVRGPFVEVMLQGE